MSDDNSLGELTTVDSGEDYFNMDYKMKPIWLGLLWWLIGVIPQIAWAAIRPGHTCAWGPCAYYITYGDAHAWNVVQYGFAPIFGALGTLWLLAYIKTDSRIMQKIYYRAIAWGIPLSWLFALWFFIAFIVGGTQDYWYNGYHYIGDVGPSIGYAIGFWIVFAGLEILGWWITKGGVVKYYRWDEQSWWNYDPEESADQWPKQLGDWVDY